MLACADRSRFPFLTAVNIDSFYWAYQASDTMAVSCISCNVMLLGLQHETEVLLLGELFLVRHLHVMLTVTA